MFADLFNPPSGVTLRSALLAVITPPPSDVSIVCRSISCFIFKDSLHYILTTGQKSKSKSHKILHIFQGYVSKFVSFCFVVFFLSTFALFALNDKFSLCCMNI